VEAALLVWPVSRMIRELALEQVAYVVEELTKATYVEAQILEERSTLPQLDSYRTVQLEVYPEVHPEEHLEVRLEVHSEVRLGFDVDLGLAIQVNNHRAGSEEDQEAVLEEAFHLAHTSVRYVGHMHTESAREVVIRFGHAIHNLGSSVGKLTEWEVTPSLQHANHIHGKSHTQDIAIHKLGQPADDHNMDLGPYSVEAKRSTDMMDSNHVLAPGIDDPDISP
jgi:hypothetical protein